MKTGILKLFIFPLMLLTFACGGSNQANNDPTGGLNTGDPAVTNDAPVPYPVGPVVNWGGLSDLLDSGSDNSSTNWSNFNFKKAVLNAAHQEYKDVTSHSIEFVKDAWNSNFAENIFPADLNSIIDFSNFFNFIYAVDHGALHGGYLDIGVLNFSAHQSLDTLDNADLISKLEDLKEACENFDKRLKLAIDIYNVPLTKVSFATDSDFSDLADIFAKNAIPANDMNYCDPNCGKKRALLRGILRAVTYKFEDENHKVHHVSFANFAGWSLKPFLTGSGGVGVIETVSVKFVE